ncbi:MAG: hypothetical protein SGBAC_002943 [Bacillariaceae sp.]
MSPNATHRQDVCDLVDAVHNGSLSLKDSLRGRQLNVVLGGYKGAYFRYSPEEGIDPVYPGISAVLLDEISRRAGFTWRSSFGVFIEPKGVEYNETWGDLLVWTVGAYDLSVDWWSRNLDRLSKGVAYPQEWYDSSIILIGKKPGAQQQSQTSRKLKDYWNMMKPFSWQVWLTTLATVVMSGLVFQILEHLNGNRGDRKFFVWWTENLFLSAINATQAYEYGTPKGAPSKIFCFSMALWSLILTATYTANLASLLVENQQPAPRRVETIQEAVVFEYPICTWEGTDSDAYIRDTFSDAIRIPKRSIEDVYAAVRSGECAFAVEAVQQWLINQHIAAFNPNCDLEWVGNGKVVSASAAGFATSTDVGHKCTGLIRDVINMHMEEIIADGFLRDAWAVENSLSTEVDCDYFLPLQVKNSDDDIGERRRSLEAAKKFDSRGLLVSRNGVNGTHRRLKASSAAASAGASEGSSTSSQMELPAMLGTFFIHWAFMFIAVVAGVIKKYYRENYKIVVAPKLDKEQHREGTNQTEKYDDTIRMKDELQFQMQDLLRSFQRSKATLVKEQDDLLMKMNQLKGVLDQRSYQGLTQDDLQSL